MNLHPSLLTSSIEEYQQQLAWVIESQVIETIQIDVIDGQFAENLTLSPLDVANVDHQELRLDFHLMTEEPIDYVNEMIEIKENFSVRAVIAQVERMSSQDYFLEEVRAQEWKTGLSLDLYTPVSAIDEESWEKLDIVQLMTIESGFQGQEFNSKALEKIKEIKKHAQKDIEIIVDGGVKEQVLETLRENEVTGVAVGSGFWKSSNPVATIQQYSGLLN